MPYTLLRRVLFFFVLIVLGVARSYSQSYLNIAIETNTYDQHETAIAIHPTDANILMATWNDNRNVGTGTTSKPGFGFSSDGGQTWFAHDIIKIQGEPINGVDPSCSFDKLGNAFYCFVKKTSIKR